jgi:hypothetical protein
MEKHWSHYAAGLRRAAAMALSGVEPVVLASEGEGLTAREKEIAELLFNRPEILSAAYADFTGTPLHLKTGERVAVEQDLVDEETLKSLAAVYSQVLVMYDSKMPGVKDLKALLLKLGLGNPFSEAPYKEGDPLNPLVLNREGHLHLIANPKTQISRLPEDLQSLAVSVLDDAFLDFPELDGKSRLLMARLTVVDRLFRGKLVERPGENITHQMGRSEAQNILRLMVEMFDASERARQMAAKSA